MIEAITQELMEPNVTPGRLSEILVQLSSKYGAISKQLSDIQAIKPQAWLELRDTVTSDKQADRLWDATDLGVKEMVYRTRLKGLEKMLPAIRKRIDVLQGEARYQY